MGVSNRECSDWKGQVRDATAFLEEHHRVLMDLTERADADSVALDFPTEADPNANLIVCDRVLPVSLVRAAGGAGVAIELTVYVAEVDDLHPEESEK